MEKKGSKRVQIGNQGFGKLAELKQKKKGPGKQSQPQDSEKGSLKKIIHKEKSKNVFSHLQKMDLSEDINMKKILVAKRKEKEDSKKFYEKGLKKIAEAKASLTQKVILKKEEDSRTFNKTFSSRIKRIKKRTIQMIKLDKFKIRDCVLALKAFYASEVNSEENRGDTIRLQVQVSNKMHSVSLRPIRIPLKHPIHTPEFKANISLIVKDGQKISDSKKQHFSQRRVTVFEYQQIKKLMKEGKLSQMIKGTDVLLCDEKLYNKIVQQCWKILGKKKIMPYPVNYDKFCKTETTTVQIATSQIIPDDLEEPKVHLNDGLKIGASIQTHEANLEIESVEDLIKNIIFVRKGGPEYEVEACRVRMQTSECVKNIINLIYDIIPQILVESPKNSTIKKISLLCDKSKLLEIYRNDYVENRGTD